MAVLHTTGEDHDALSALAEKRALSQPPLRPGPGECCERACDPCVWDYYERALSRWCERHNIDRPVPRSHSQRC